MVLIVGLGNPGEKYSQNRHNVGFMFADYFLKKIGEKNTYHLEKKFDAEISKINHGQQDFIFMKPQTYMNRSGDSVQRVMAFYKVPLDSLYVVHDDLDIPLGKFKIQKSTGPKLHNGIESIENKLGTSDFYRIRIGVDNRAGEKIAGETYVLQDFKIEEQSQLQDIFSDILSHPELLFVLKSQ